MFLWSYRQVILFFVLFVAFAISLGWHNKQYDIWLERVFTVMFIVGAIAWFAHNMFQR